MEREEIWSFETANFKVAFEVSPEDMDPADSFQFDEDIAAVRNGDVDWFVAWVVVYGPDGEELAYDCLGGCAYKSAREFHTGHRDPDPMNRNCSLMRAARGENVSICHYFPGMVSEAIAEARREIDRRKATWAGVTMRANA